MRFSFTLLALTLPLLVASQTKYSISGKISGYYIYLTDVYRPGSSVNITTSANNPSAPGPAALTVSPTLTGTSAQDVSITNGTLYIGVYVDPNNGPLVVWTSSAHTWTVTPQTNGGYSVMEPKYKTLWSDRSDSYKDILLISSSNTDQPSWNFNKAN